MNDIRGWDYDYLGYAENRLQLQHFLQEQDQNNLQNQAIEILSKREDTISFGFVAGRAIELDSNGRNVHNPLYPIWGLLRQRARKILSAPSFDDPLGYAYLDYRLAVWILSIVGVPTDIYICLKTYKNNKDNNSALASDLATTIINLGQQSSNLDTSVKKKYEEFLLEEIMLYPKDNLRAIRGLLLDSAESTWMPYLNRIQEEPNLNKKLSDNVLFFLLQSSIPSVVENTIDLIKCFFENQRKQHTLYYFFEQATKEDRIRLQPYLDKNMVPLGKTTNRDLHFNQIEQLPRLLISKQLYEKFPEEQAAILLRYTYEYIIHKCHDFGTFFSFLLFLYQSKHKELIERTMKQVLLIIDKRHEAQEFPLNSREFIALIQNSP